MGPRLGGNESRTAGTTIAGIPPARSSTLIGNITRELTFRALLLGDGTERLELVILTPGFRRTPGLKFRVLLTENGAERVQLARA